MEQAKFSVGQRVIRIVDGRGSTVLEVIKNDDDVSGSKFIYCISYDEGETPGSQNEGKGWWEEDSLQAE